MKKVCETCYFRINGVPEGFCRADLNDIKKYKCSCWKGFDFLYNTTLSKFAVEINVPLWKAMEFGKYFRKKGSKRK